jgi:phage terminase large subunit-like protein
LASTDAYPHWLFDESPIADPFGYGERAVKFLRALKHPKTGRAFQLDPWQERLVRRIYGPRNPDGTRVVRSVVMLVSRGARKTSLGAALGLLHTIGPEKVQGGQVICAAFAREQARIAFDEASGLVMAHPKVRAACDVLDYRHTIRGKTSRATFRAISAEANAAFGLSPNFALIDEIHTFKNDQLVNAIRAGLAKMPDSLCITISQAGRGSESIAFDTFEYARKVARGEVENPAVLPVLFENPADADIYDEATWHRANPGLKHGYPSIESLRELAREAKDRPSVRELFRSQHCGIWLENLADPWLDLHSWDECATATPIDQRKGEPAWIGVDLSSVSDLTAVVIAFRDDDGGFSVYPYVFAPEAGLRARQDKGDGPYVQWSEDGHLIATPGEVVDYRLVEAKIRELCERFDVREIAFDRWNATEIKSNLLDDGLPVVDHGQGFASMNAPMRAFERAAISKNLRHDGNPILRFCVANVTVVTDPAGNIKPGKSSRRDLKTDAAVAGIMAVGRAEVNEGGCVYSDIAARPEGIMFW